LVRSPGVGAAGDSATTVRYGRWPHGGWGGKEEEQGEHDGRTGTNEGEHAKGGRETKLSFNCW